MVGPVVFLTGTSGWECGFSLFPGPHSRGLWFSLVGHAELDLRTLLLEQINSLTILLGKCLAD